MLASATQAPGALAAPHSASKWQACPTIAASVDKMAAQVPGAACERPRRSIVLRRLAPSWEKSQVRPSYPP